MALKHKLGYFFGAACISAIFIVMLVFDRFVQPGVNNSLNPNDFSKSCINQQPNKTIDVNGELTVSVWNIYKQQNEGWAKDLSLLLDNSQLVLLQEASLTKGLIAVIQRHNKNANMARAFNRLNIVNGVMDLASVQPIRICSMLAPEPWIRLAKSALVAEYPLSNGQNLLAINLHSINFSWFLNEYKAQLLPLFDALKAHKGPIIIAGDFNTWRQARLNLIEELVNELELKEATPEIDLRSRFLGYPLDHLYYRDFNLLSVTVTETQSSDHNPMQVKFSLFNHD